MGQCGRPRQLVGLGYLYHTHVWIGSFCRLEKIICGGAVATRLLATSAPSMMNIDVAPVSANAWFAAIVRALSYCGIGLPNVALAVAANNGAINFYIHFVLEQFEITTVAVSFSMQAAVVGVVGSGELGVAKTIFNIYVLPPISPSHTVSCTLLLAAQT